MGAGGARGLPDEEVIEQAIREQRIVVTFDLDFGRLYYFHHRGRVGILVLRLNRLTFSGQEGRLKEFLGRVDLEGRGLERSLIVLEAHRYRILR